jgi:hypothetical protein
MSASLREELQRLRTENALLRGASASASASASGGRAGRGGGGRGGAPSPQAQRSPGAAGAAADHPVYGEWGPPPRRALGQMRIWVGSWNMVRERKK